MESRSEWTPGLCWSISNGSLRASPLEQELKEAPGVWQGIYPHVSPVLWCWHGGGEKRSNHKEWREASGWICVVIFGWWSWYFYHRNVEDSSISNERIFKGIKYEQFLCSKLSETGAKITFFFLNLECYKSLKAVALIVLNSNRLFNTTFKKLILLQMLGIHW